MFDFVRKYISAVCSDWMDKITRTYYKYADQTDILHNDIVLPHKNLHRFLRKMGVRLGPLELASLIAYLDPEDYGYVTLQSIRDTWDLSKKS